MFDAKKLLDQFLGSQDCPETGIPTSRVTDARRPAAFPRAAAWVAHSAAAVSAPGRQRARGRLPFRQGRQLGSIARSNPLKTGALAAVLLGSGKGREIAGTALKLGGLAVIAGLGYQAYKNYQSGQSPAPDLPARRPR